MYFLLFLCSFIWHLPWCITCPKAATDLLKAWLTPTLLNEAEQFHFSGLHAARSHTGGTFKT
jgi:hypothetical protein